jgi:Fe-S-cluster-containing dehydrogenase component/DMSO reductase anchor subunit
VLSISSKTTRRSLQRSGNRFNVQESATSTLIDELLVEQQTLTAAVRFARHHERGELPAHARYYRDLIPLTQPEPGQQYAFEVDLDRCSGCKACVSACHSLNGLDDGETWRQTGLLVSQDWAQPFQQTVTAACHHCLDPGCLDGCPVLAYDKDPVTGIVRHLDDQCIGCQYCVMKCPYDVPKYLPQRGIVRKCDMCADRLAAAEAPACVQACPSEAIRIVIAEKEEIRKSAERGEFLPAAPNPGYTVPGTRYKSKKRLPSDLVAGDHGNLKPSESHLPLVFMLVLSQLAAGTSVAAAICEPSRLFSVIAVTAGGLAPLVALLHLGKPSKAWRAFLGWRTSWFSREVIAFGVFVPLTAAGLLTGFTGLKLLACLAGLSGVACSAMIYADTRREFWRASQTFGKFFQTTLLLGTAAMLAVQIMARRNEALVSAGVLLAATTAAKLFFEFRIFRDPGGAGAGAGMPTPLNNSARLLAGELAPIVRLRVVCGVLGGMICPALVIESLAYGLVKSTAMTAIALAVIALCLAGEFLERYLFFTALAPERMPGGLAA